MKQLNFLFLISWLLLIYASQPGFEPDTIFVSAGGI